MTVPPCMKHPRISIYKRNLKSTVMDIEKLLIMIAYVFQKYPEIFAFQLFITL